MKKCLIVQQNQLKNSLKAQKLNKIKTYNKNNEI
jgi:hypothetical protein